MVFETITNKLLRTDACIAHEDKSHKRPAITVIKTGILAAFSVCEARIQQVSVVLKEWGRQVDQTELFDSGLGLPVDHSGPLGFWNPRC